jgi:hypothetical protein
LSTFYGQKYRHFLCRKYWHFLCWNWALSMGENIVTFSVANIGTFYVGIEHFLWAKL